MAKLAFGTRHRQRIGMPAEYRSDRIGFSDVTERRARPMSIDIINFVRTQTAISQRSVHRIGSTRTFGIGDRQMNGISRLTIPQHFTQNCGSAFQRKFPLLQNQNSGTLRKHKSVAIHTERP